MPPSNSASPLAADPGSISGPATGTKQLTAVGQVDGAGVAAAMPALITKTAATAALKLFVAMDTNLPCLRNSAREDIRTAGRAQPLAT
jgi:hypothetical protein